MKFYNDDHYDKYLKLLNEGHRSDAEWTAVLYLGTLLDAIKPGFMMRMFDFEHERIRTSCLDDDWQTSTTRKICLLAFNLWNGFVDPDSPRDSSVLGIFDGELDEYFIDAIRIRVGILYE